MGSSGINGRYMGILFLKACQERCSDLQLWLAAWPWPPLRPTPTTALTATAWATLAMAVTALATPAMSDMLVMEATLPPATTSLIPLVLATSLRGRLRLMPTTALTATEVTVPDTALFLPLAPLLLLEPTLPPPPLPPLPSAATAPPPLSEPTSPTAMLPPATTGPILLEPSTLPRGPLILTTATATDMDTATDTLAPSPPESPLSLMPDSPSRATLRATATATTAMVTNLLWSDQALESPQWYKN